VTSRLGQYRKILERILERDVLEADGVSEEAFAQAESRLWLRLPVALREYFLIAGNADDANRMHNLLFRPDEFIVEDGYLVFMEENQAVVHWGIPIDRCDEPDPSVWQRVNGPEPEWYSEELPFSSFMVKNLAWQAGLEAE
jgi:hypothetical protein